jgi:hypothetical protein
MKTLCAINLIAISTIIAMACCSTADEKREKKNPSLGVKLYGYQKICEGKVYMKTFRNNAYGTHGNTHKLLRAVERFASDKRVLSQKNIYSNDNHNLEYIELIACVFDGKKKKPKCPPCMKCKSPRATKEEMVSTRKEKSRGSIKH